jgi:Holliday junction resolvase RusA-like endonuclease
MTCDCPALVVAFDVPCRPEPKRRPRFGNGRTYTDARTVAYEGRIATACRDAMKGRPPYDGPVELACLFEQRNRRVADTDNLVKAISDAIEGIAFTNDRHVSRIRAGRVAGADVDRVSVAVIAKETP